jgi:hypothetical protein
MHYKLHERENIPKWIFFLSPLFMSFTFFSHPELNEKKNSFRLKNFSEWKKLLLSFKAFYFSHFERYLK